MATVGSINDIYRFGIPDAGAVLIQPVDEHDLAFIENEAEYIRQRAGTDFMLLALRVGDWNRDLSPWPAPAVFGKDDFGGGAQATLEQILLIAKEPKKKYYIGGYSLAGLFALWAAYRTDIFTGVAAASPSVWFPGFTDHMKACRIGTGSVYLSLGDREEKTRNPVMASVGRNIREAHALLCAQGVDCVLEWNEGNHFKDVDIRTARAFLWTLDNTKEQPAR
ncbi:MAG: esterase [Clostridia bacterium]|nr:esterase [Clostridia bacterium]